MEILIRVILDPPEVIVHEATNNTDDIVYTLQQVEKIEAGFQCNTVCKSLKYVMHTFYVENAKTQLFLFHTLLKCNTFESLKANL